jgi:phage tail sheath protein FI
VTSVDSNYVGSYYPWVKTIDSRTNRLTAVPPSVLMPGIYAANDAVAAEWFAPAGLNRGGIVGAVSVLNRLTQSERDSLYEAKVNPIATFPGEGIVAFGQKTLQDRASALDRINVRRLLIKVKKYIASTSRYLSIRTKHCSLQGLNS